MTWIAGADGCRAGWIVSSRHARTGELRVGLCESAAKLMPERGGPRVLAIDVPIGLPDAGARECDRMARQLLGRPRGSSVFPAPIRPAIGARDQAEASAITRAADGRGVAAQAFGIYRKVAEVDGLLCRRPSWRRRIHEAHPELSFAQMNAGRPLASSKKDPAGRGARVRLLEAWLGPGAVRACLDQVRSGARVRRTAVADDDVVDALAVLWTAQRILERRAVQLPEVPPRDRTGLPMRIVC